MPEGEDEAATATATAAAAERRWAILASIPSVVPASELQKGKDLALALSDPAGVSVLKVARDFIPEIKRSIPPTRYPNIVASDPSGLLLVCASHLSEWWPHTARYDVDYKQDIMNEDVEEDESKFSSYLLCDTNTLTVSRLPEYVRSPLTIHHSGDIGLIGRDDGQFMVAELQPGNGRADLLCHLVGTDGWVSKALDYSPDHPKWGHNGVISHGGELWWVDLSCGLLACDPFADQPVLRYVPLPEGSVVPAAGTRFFAAADSFQMNIDKYRCVKVSDGKLRYVQIDNDVAAPKMIRVWTMANDPERAEWTPEYAVNFVDIWKNQGYMVPGIRLPREVPVLALIHPWNPAVVYFWQYPLIFAVDVPARKLLDCNHFFMPALLPPREFPSSRFVQAWELPPAALPRDLDGGSLSSLRRKIRGFWRPRKIRGFWRPAKEQDASSSASHQASDVEHQQENLAEFFLC